MGVDVHGSWITGSSDLRDGQWHHVAVTFQKRGTVLWTNVIRLYVDGGKEVIFSLQNTFVNTGVGQNVHLGLWSLGVTNHFNGMLDTTLIYDEALTHEK